MSGCAETLLEKSGGSVNLGKSTSVLLNDVIPTKDRSTLDKVINSGSSVLSGVVSYLDRKIGP